MFILMFVSDCGPTFVDACQYCDKKYCGDCSPRCMNICQGEGCNRVNCDGGECFNNREERQETVTLYTDRADLSEFCGDCYPGEMDVLRDRLLRGVH